jgi:hypothetical protein
MDVHIFILLFLFLFFFYDGTNVADKKKTFFSHIKHQKPFEQDSRKTIQQINGEREREYISMCVEISHRV